MHETRAAAMEKVYADEGGYCDDPHDPGGATKYGITIIDYRKHINPLATKADVKAMTKEEAQKIYDIHYLTPMHYDELFAGLDYTVVDAAINSGVGRAPKWLQGALAAKSSGMAILVALAGQAKDKQGVLHKYWSLRLSFLQGLKNWQYFGKGWGKRCATGEAFAVRLWLQFDAKVSAVEQKKELGKVAEKAKSKVKQNGSATVAQPGAGSAVAGGFSSWDSLSLGGKMALIGLAVALFLGTIYTLHWAIQHYRRQKAFEAEMEKVQ